MKVTGFQEGGFFLEVLDELVDLLTKPKSMGEIAVVLAGYDKRINDLIAINSNLSSRFPDEIIFPNMSPSHCLQIPERSLDEKEMQAPTVRETGSPEYKIISDLNGKTRFYVEVEKRKGCPGTGAERDRIRSQRLVL